MGHVQLEAIDASPPDERCTRVRLPVLPGYPAEGDQLAEAISGDMPTTGSTSGTTSSGTSPSGHASR